MRNGEWRLVYDGTDLLFGTPATPVFNSTTPSFSSVEVRNSDTDNPRSDGRAFGVDYRGGLSVTFDLTVRSSSEDAVRSEAAGLATAWRADAVRRTPGAVAELHACYAGKERVLYGRPRRFAPDYADAAINHLIGVDADFECVDDVFYDAEEKGVTIQLVPPSGGGLLAPLAAPLSTTATSDRSTVFTVGGVLPAWPVVEIEGPITNPVVEIVGLYAFEFATSLAYDESVVIDARPWRRSVLRSDGASLAGKFTRSTPRLPDAGLPPGSYELSLRGQDATGTATARLRWRDAYPTQ